MFVYNHHFCRITSTRPPRAPERSFHMNTADSPSTPPRARIGALLGRLAAGLLAGLLGAALGGWLGSAAGQGSAGGWGDLIGAVLGMLGGYALGAPAGVIGLAALLREPGRPWRALLGSVLGAAAVLLLAEPLRLNRHSGLLAAAFGLVVLAATLAGFHRGAGAQPNNDGGHGRL